MHAGELEAEAVLDRAVFFLIGMPARTLLETCLRSLGLDGLLASGVRITRESMRLVGAQHELAPLFAELLGLKERLAAALDLDDVQLLRFELFLAAPTEAPRRRARGGRVPPDCRVAWGARDKGDAERSVQGWLPEVLVFSMRRWRA